MTIFGFNTDVKHGDTIYHVQSEARVSDLLVQTLVFVKGLCVGKRTSSYAHEASRAGFSDQVIHELLKTQHRSVVESVSEGKMESAVGTVGEVQDIGGSGLALKWVKTEPFGLQDRIAMHFQVTDAGMSVAGAKVVARITPDDNAPIIARSTSDGSGNVEMHIGLTDDLRREGAVIVQAVHGSKSATRKFRLKSKESGDRS